MAIKIENNLIGSIDELPSKVQCILSFIPRAKYWFSRNLSVLNAELEFPSYEIFVNQLALSLHGSSILFVKELSIFLGVSKLFDMAEHDIRNIYEVNRYGLQKSIIDDFEKIDIAKIFDKYSLIDNSKIESGYQIDEFRLPSSSFAIGATLDDQLAWVSTMDRLRKIKKSSSNVIEEAEKWSVKKSQTLTEYCQYLEIYLIFTERYFKSEPMLAKLRGDTNSKKNVVDDFLDKAIPIIVNNMTCPVLDERKDQHVLSLEIANWRSTNDRDNTIGFYTLSSALLMIIRNMEIGDEEDVSVDIQNYIEKLNQTLMERLPFTANVNQSGTLYQYFYNLDKSQLILNLDEQGCLSVFDQIPV